MGKHRVTTWLGRRPALIATAAVLAAVAGGGVVVAGARFTGGERGAAPAGSERPASTAPGQSASGTPGASGATGATGSGPAVPSGSASSTGEAGAERESSTGELGWPGPATTGVPAGTTLRRSGSITVTKRGTVLDRLDVAGCITVHADNVTIKRTRVRGTCASGTISTSDGDRDHTGLLIEDVEVDGASGSTSYPLVAYSGFTCRRCNLHHGGHPVQLGHGVVVEYSWIHDVHTGEGSHNSAIGAFSSYDLVIRHNRLECNDTTHCTAALALLEDGNGPIHDVLAEGNYFSGGGYCVYAGVYGGGSTNIRFRDNAFAQTPHPRCGEYGPLTAYQPGAGNEWTGNYWADAKRTPVPAS